MNNTIITKKKDRGMLFVVSGPSGVGKSTLLRDALKDLEDFVKSVSATTRPKRNSEKLKQHYHFISESDFMDMVSRNDFLEWANYCGYYYGTPRKFVEESLSKGINVILEIEVKGAMQIKEKEKDAYFIFISVPGLDHLKARLKKRSTESSEEIENRLKKAEEELKFQKFYDCIIVNNNYNEALKNLKYVLNKVSGRNAEV